MRNLQSRSQQQGLALLAALLVIIIFTILGMTSLRKARESEKISGADVRYDTVFEAGEQTLRLAANLLAQINAPKAGNGDANREKAENFNASIANVNALNKISKEQDTFVWTSHKLRTFIKKNKKNEPLVDSNGDPIRGSYKDFIGEIDNDEFWKRAVISKFTTKDDENITGNNYLNNIVTYTFVEELRNITDLTAPPPPSESAPNSEASEEGRLKEKVFYLITIKASGFPPGTLEAKQKAENARENVIIQAVFANFKL